MQIPLESIRAVAFTHAKRDANSHRIDSNIWLVHLLDLAIVVCPDLGLAGGSTIAIFERLVRVFNQEFVLAISVKIDELGESNALGSIVILINLDSLTLAVLLLVLEDLVGEQLVCRLYCCLGRGLGLLLGLRELDALGGVRTLLGIVDLHGGRTLLFALARGDGHLILLVGQLAKVLHGKAVLAIDFDGIALALTVRGRQLDGIAGELFALAVLGQNFGLARADNIALAARSHLGRRANTRHDNDGGDNGNNGHTADNGSDDTVLVPGLLGLRRRIKRPISLGGLDRRIPVITFHEHIRRNILRSMLPRRSSHRRIPYRKRHRLRLVLYPTHARSAARTKRGAVGYLSSALGAIHRISRLFARRKHPRAVLPTTPYGRNHDSCCATLPTQKMIRMRRRKTDHRTGPTL